MRARATRTSSFPDIPLVKKPRGSSIVHDNYYDLLGSYTNRV